ncbi:hypothetical protein BH11MYX3_BH11MYX3_15000 [soil metagenome]
MSQTSIGVRMAALSMVASAGLGIWLELREPTSEAAIVAGVAALTLLTLVAPFALIPFVRQRLAPWAFVGIAVWVIGGAIAIYLGAWVYLLLFEGATWAPGNHWFIAEIACLMAGQTLVLIAIAAGLPSQPAPRPIKLLVITLASGVLAFVVVACQTAFMNASPGSMELFRWTSEIAHAGTMLLFAWGLVDADRTLRRTDPPAARTLSRR